MCRDGRWHVSAVHTLQCAWMADAKCQHVLQQTQRGWHSADGADYLQYVSTARERQQVAHHRVETMGLDSPAHLLENRRG